MAIFGTVTMSDHIPKLAYDEPDKKVRPPVVALVGPEHSGKSTELARFSADPRLGGMFVAEWGAGDKGVLNEYAALPGTRMKFLRHNNSVQAVYGQVRAAREVAIEARDKGELPIALAIDSWSTCWNLIKDWTTRRAVTSMLRKAETQKRQIDPNAFVEVTNNLWTDAAERYRQIMTVLLTWPGPVILTCRAEWVTVFEDGKPTRDHEWSITCHKTLKSDATAIVRMNRGMAPELTKCRSIHLQLDPKAKPLQLDGFSLADLIFERMKYDPANSVVPDVEERLDDIPDEGPVIGAGRPPAQQTPRAAQLAGAESAEGVDWMAKLAFAQRLTDDGWAGVRQRVAGLYKAAGLAGAPDALGPVIAAAGVRAMWLDRFSSIPAGDVEALRKAVDEAREATVHVEPLLEELGLELPGGQA